METDRRTEPMQLGLIGLGRMGANMATRLLDAGHDMVVYDLDPDAAASLAERGATVADSPADLASRLRPPRHVWIMVPVGETTETTIEAVHVGPAGAGHFTKMVHNGIEYGLMQAYAEGFAVMRAKEDLDLDLAAIAEVWRHGSVVRSWLLDLTAEVLAGDADLAGVAPYVEDSGEGRWTVAEAIDLDVPAPVITLALLQRLRSRDAESFGDRLLAAMRHAFGGHAIREEGRRP